jgi:hypothetical protein
MRSLSDPRLTTWFEDGLAAGRFRIPGGRDIILNEFPRLMRETRFLASSRVSARVFREFLLGLNPKILDIPNGSPEGLNEHLAAETETLPGLRKSIVFIPPHTRFETWYVYTPPLETMRRAWKAARAQGRMTLPNSSQPDAGASSLSPT